MENNLYELHELVDLIEHEKHIYSEAIKNNRQFEDVKSIFLKIKKLEKEADTLMQQPSSQKNISYSAKDELQYLKLKKDYINKAQAYTAAIENLTLEMCLIR